MTQGSSVRIENLFYSLKEVQNEKSCLEQKLQEKKQQRSLLIQELEAANSKNDHVQERHRHMSETCAVAQQKVDQTSSTCQSLQANIDRNKPKLAQLQAAIESEKHKQMENMKDFETKLEEISSELFHAKDFYKKSALQRTIEKTRKERVALKLKEEKMSKDVQRLTRYLEKLNADEKSCAVSNFGVEASLCACLSALERDKKEAESYLEKVKNELKKVHDVLNNAQDTASVD